MGQPVVLVSAECHKSSGISELGSRVFTISLFVTKARAYPLVSDYVEIFPTVRKR